MIRETERAAFPSQGFDTGMTYRMWLIGQIAKGQAAYMGAENTRSAGGTKQIVRLADDICREIECN